MANHTGKGMSDTKFAITVTIVPDETPPTQPQGGWGGDEAWAERADPDRFPDGGARPGPQVRQRRGAIRSVVWSSSSCSQREERSRFWRDSVLNCFVGASASRMRKRGAG